MPFIGKLPDVGAFRLIDSITTSATDTYALQVEGLSYFPSSARNLIVSLNGVTQAPESAYTVSGSNIIFDSALTASDVIDYILVIGESVDIGTPSDNTVGNAQLKSDLDFSGKTLTFSADQISGDAINGGTISSFASTGIDDNATSTAITIDASQNVGVGTNSPSYKLHSVGDALLVHDPDGANTALVAVGAGGTSNVLIDGNTISLRSETGAVQVTKDASGNVGIGTSSPSSLDSTANNLVIGAGTSTTGMTIYGSTTSDCNIYFADGTSGADAYRGIVNYNHSVDAMRFFTSGTEHMRIDSNGKVGIGTSSPSGVLAVTDGANALIVGQSGENFYSGNTHRFFSQNYTTEHLHINASGNVGIGTASPIAGHRLHVTGRIVTTGPSNGGYILARDTNTGGADLYMNPALTAAGTPAIQVGTNHPLLFATNNTERMRITGNGYLIVGNTAVDTASSITLKDEGSIRSVYASGVGGDSLFGAISGLSNGYQITADASNNQTYTWHNGGAVSMRIDSSGRVGIGTTTLVNPLTVKLTANANSKTSGSAFDGGAIRLTSSSGLSGTNSEMAILAGAEDTLSAGIGFARENGGNWGTQIRFYTHGTAITTTDELTERMRLDAGGNLLVSITTNTSGNGATGKINVRQDGISATSAPILAANEAGSGSLIIFSGNGGGVSTANRIYHGGASVVYATSSDERLKKNITPAPSAVAVLNSVEAVSFDWKATDQHTKYGFIAQQFVDVVPDAIIKGSTDDEPWGMDYGKVTPFLLKAIQEQQAMIEELKAEVAALKGA